MKPRKLFVVTLASSSAYVGCGSEADIDPPACLAAPPTVDCRSDFSPTFDEIFDRVLSQTCATAGASCHGPAGAQGGLAFTDADSAYDQLLGISNGRARVVPGDPPCSRIMVRLESVGEPWQMPPGGMPIPTGQRCAMRRWIAEGALR